MFCAPLVPLSGTLRSMPGGMRAPYFTLRQMRRLVNEWKTAPEILQAATNLVFTVPSGDDWREAAALFEWVRDGVRYLRDVHGIEVLSTPGVTLQRRVGDCDDKATLLATLFEAVGLPTRFVIAGYRGPDFEHVYLQVLIGGQWIDADATEPYPMGYAPPLPTALDFERV
jgi:hypothetical protein